MKTLDRVCIKDHTVADQTGKSFTIYRGKTYLTSEEEKGEVTVLSQYWVKVPANIFAGEKVFTE